MRKPSIITTRFLTAARADLFALTADLTRAIPDTVYQDPTRPLLMTVEGTVSSGKKIITDAAIEYLFDKMPGTPKKGQGQTAQMAAQMKGRLGYDEYWRGRRKGEIFELHYMDNAWPRRTSYSASLRRGRKSKLADFMAQRRHGGLTIIQNLGVEAEPDIRMIIEAHDRYPVGYYRKQRLETLPSSLQDHFNQLARQNDWARYVKIQIRDERLQNDPAFMNFFTAYAAFCPLVRTPTLRENFMALFRGRPREADPPGIGPAPVFGKNFPHAPGP